MAQPEEFNRFKVDDSSFGRLSRARVDKVRGKDFEWVYFIQSHSEPYRIKIGKTNNLRGRLMGLQWMCPVQLSVLYAHIWPVYTEPALHECFKSLRSHGEWFYPGDNLVEAIEALLAGDPPEEPLELLRFLRPYSSPTIDPEEVMEGVYAKRADAKAKRTNKMEDDYWAERWGWKPKGSARLTRDFELPR